MSSSLQNLNDKFYDNNNLWVFGPLQLTLFILLIFLASFFIGMWFCYENYCKSPMINLTITPVERQYNIMYFIDDIFSNKSPEELLAIETKRLNELSNSTLCIPKLDYFYDENHTAIAEYLPNEIKINKASGDWNNSLTLTIILRHELMHHYFYHKCETEKIYINNKKSSLEDSIAEVYSGALSHSKKTCDKLPYCIFDGVKDKDEFMGCVFQNCKKDKFLSLEESMECYDSDDILI